MEGLAASMSSLTICQLESISVDGRKYNYCRLNVDEKKFKQLPICLRILYENSLRKAHFCTDSDIAQVWRSTAQSILDRETKSEILFQPGRVVLQDFTGVAALVDLASMRDLAAAQGQDPRKIDSKCPADLVVDHSVQVDYSHVEKQVALAEKQQQELNQQFHAAYQQQTFPPYFNASGVNGGEVYYNYEYQQPVQGACALPCSSNSIGGVPVDNPGLPIQDEICPFHQRISYWSETLQKNRHSEMQKNDERFQFLKYVDASFDNITVIPPGTGVMHQVNLEYLARVVSVQDDVLFPDTCVGTDTHTTMVNGLGVLGWTVGTLEAEAAMFDHPVVMACPKVVGLKLIGKVPVYATSTDVVLLISKEIRKQLTLDHDNIFVEFFGPSVKLLSIADRSAVANLCNEYNAKTGFFPVDACTLDYLAQTGREKHSLKVMQKYLELNGLFRVNPDDADYEEDIIYDEIIEVYLPDIVVTISGPTRSKDKVELEDVAKDFKESLSKKFDRPHAGHGGIFNIDIDGEFHSIKDGSILLSSIASCSNTSNPSVMLTAGLLAKKAVEAGLSVPKFVKRSLCPGSGVVTSYLQDSGVMPYLHMLGFEVMGYGCSTCCENACVQPLLPPESLVCCGILAGNRNFQGRLLPEIKANYLASPPLVIAYALAGRIDIDFNQEPLGKDANDKPVFLKDIWPSRSEVHQVEKCQVIPSVFNLVSNRIRYGNKEWSNLNVPTSLENPLLYQWNPGSTFIRPPLYLTQSIQKLADETRCLLKLGDDVSCDMISPAGSIVRGSPAGDYLTDRGLVPRQFQSFGTRRGNSEVMARGTFSHAKLKNLMVSKAGSCTVHCPSGVLTSIFDASVKYKEDSVSCIVIAGHNFGRGSARDWATKGPSLLGIKAILALSFSSLYKHNMIRTGILPVQIDEETYAELTGHELFHVEFDTKIEDNNEVTINVNNSQRIYKAKHLLANAYEVKLFQNGGVIRDTLDALLE